MGWKLLFYIIIIIGVVLVFTINYVFWGKAHVCIEDKWVYTDVSCGGDGCSSSTEYRVVTDKGMFIVSSAWWRFQFTKPIEYSRMKVGECYNIKYHGPRLNFISWFPIIYEVS